MVKILVVDDESEICEMICGFFERRGHSVLAVTDPRQVLGLVEKEKPQLIILDLLMPQVDGFTILRKLKAKDKSIKVIILSVADNPDNIAQAKALGADDFVKKPFSLDSLAAVVMTQIQDTFSL